MKAARIQQEGRPGGPPHWTGEDCAKWGGPPGLPSCWLRRALLDLKDGYSYVAAGKPAAARRLVDQIEEGVRQLSLHPNLGRPGRVPGTRELVIAGTPFLVVYRLEADRTAILTVLHGARRWPR